MFYEEQQKTDDRFYMQTHGGALRYNEINLDDALKDKIPQNTQDMVVDIMSNARADVILDNVAMLVAKKDYVNALALFKCIDHENVDRRQRVLGSLYSSIAYTGGMVLAYRDKISKGKLPSAEDINTIGISIKKGIKDALDTRRWLLSDDDYNRITVEIGDVEVLYNKLTEMFASASHNTRSEP